MRLAEERKVSLVKRVESCRDETDSGLHGLANLIILSSTSTKIYKAPSVNIS